MKKIIFILFIHLCVNISYAQKELNYHINLYTQCSIFNLKNKSVLEIDLSRIQDTMIVSYCVIDSVQTIQFRNDPEYNRVLDLMMKLKPQESDSVMLSDTKKLLLKYSIFFRDTMLLDKSENQELFGLTDLFGNNDNKIISDMNKQSNNIILDGDFFQITITDHNKLTTKYSIHALNKFKNPITYKLVSSLLDAYRIKHPMTLLEKSHKTSNF